MKSLRQQVLTVALSGGLVAAGMFLATPPAGAAALVNGSGAISCTLTAGSIKFSPGLAVSVSQVNQVTIKTAETCTGANGSMTAKVSGSFKLTGSQADLLGCIATNIPLVYKWKGGTKHLAQTTATGNNAGGALTSSLVFDIPGGTAEGCSPVGTCTITGSYAGESCANHWVISTISQNKKTLAIKKIVLSGGTTTIS